MTGKRIVLTAQARHDIRHATAWYRNEGGTLLAKRWAVAIKQALLHIGTHPKTGFTRHAIELKLDGIRCWHVHGFPYLVFYAEHDQQIEVGRVLHAQRDIPAWMGGAECAFSTKTPA